MFKILQQILQRTGSAASKTAYDLKTIGQRYFPGTPTGTDAHNLYKAAVLPGTGSGFLGGYTSVARGLGSNPRNPYLGSVTYRVNPYGRSASRDLFGSGDLVMPYQSAASRGVASGFEVAGAMMNPRLPFSPLQYLAGPAALDMFMKINPRNPDSPTIYQDRSGGYMQMGKEQMQQNDPSVDPYGTLLDPNSPFYTPMSPGSGLF